MKKKKGKGKILVVDDTPANIDVVRTPLESDGYEVIVATSGEKALKYVNLSAPDLILLDVVMPGLDGFETCRCLKAEKKTREIPVIFMTSLTDTETKVTGFEVGGADYVTKPIEIEEVLARVRTHLAFRNICLELEKKNERLQLEITERERAEMEVQKLNAELEQRVEEKTSELETLKRSFEKINTAMKVLLEKRKENKTKIEDNVLTNVKELIVPYN